MFSIGSITIIHINGVNTTKEQAENNRDALESNLELDINLINNKQIELLYNQTHGFFLDVFWDTLGKKFKEIKYVSLDDYTDAYLEKHPEDFEIPRDILKEQIQKEYNDLYFSLTNRDVVMEEFKKIIPQIESNNYAANKSDYILLLSHSQGNLYANNVYDELINNEKLAANNISIFGIATPSRSIRGNEPDNYITATNDFVINSARLLEIVPYYNNILPANVTLNNCEDGLLGIYMCHSLIEAYLNNKDIVNKIRNFVVNKLNNLLNNLINDNVKQAKLYITQNDSSSNVGMKLYQNKNKIFDSESLNLSFNKLNLMNSKYFYYFPKNEIHGALSVALPLSNIQTCNFRNAIYTLSDMNISQLTTVFMPYQKGNYYIKEWHSTTLSNICYGSYGSIIHEHKSDFESWIIDDYDVPINLIIQ